MSSIFIGVQNISITDIMQWNQGKMNIIILTRLPRLISIVVAGVGMSVGGVIM